MLNLALCWVPTQTIIARWLLRINKHVIKIVIEYTYLCYSPRGEGAKLRQFFKMFFFVDVKINKANHELFGDMLKTLNDNKTSSRTMFADAVFVDDATKIRQEYRSYLERVYNGEARDVDFADKETVKTIINE